MKTQTNIPQLRFPEFKGEWERKKLGDITFKTDKKNKQKEILPVYSISNKFGFIPQSEQFDGVDSIERGYDTSLYKIIENNTFAYNPARINVGSIGYSENLGRLIVSSLYVCFQTKENIDDNFLFHFFNTTKFNNSVLTNGEGGVRIYLFYENFSSIPFSLPSLSEQKKIASFISAIDKKISELKQKKNLLEQYKKGIMQKIFSQELRFKDENGKEFPKWEKKKLGEVGKFAAGGDLNKLDYKKDKTGKYIYPIYANGAGEGIYGYATTFQYQSNCVTVSGRGNLGFANARKENFNAIVRLIVIIPKRENNSKYLEEAINNVNFAIESTGVPQLTVPQISAYSISIPCLEEQTKIANFLSAIDEKINQTEIQIEKTMAYKKGLLQKMFC